MNNQNKTLSGCLLLAGIVMLFAGIPAQAQILLVDCGR